MKCFIDSGDRGESCEALVGVTPHLSAELSQKRLFSIACSKDLGYPRPVKQGPVRWRRRLTRVEYEQDIHCSLIQMFLVHNGAAIGMLFAVAEGVVW